KRRGRCTFHAGMGRTGTGADRRPQRRRKNWRRAGGTTRIEAWKTTRPYAWGAEQTAKSRTEKTGPKPVSGEDRRRSNGGSGDDPGHCEKSVRKMKSHNLTGGCCICGSLLFRLYG